MIIGITGKKSAGKDTIAEYLMEQYDFCKLSFAALLKQSAAALFDIDPKAWELYKNDPSVRIELREYSESTDQSYPDPGLLITDFSARQFLQRYGTEAHREVFHDSFWIEMMWRSLDGEDYRDKNIVIPDCRFANEAQSVIDHDGVIWRIVRTGQDMADGHASEDLSQTDPFVSLELQNDGGLEKLYLAVDEAMELHGF